MALSAYALTTLATLKSELGISGTAEDTRLERLIEVASRRMIGLLNREQVHYVEDRQESVRGVGNSRLRLQVAPLRSIGSIAFTSDGGVTSSTVAATDYTIEDEGLAWVLRLGGLWAYTGDRIGATRDPVPGTERPYYLATYTGGWVTPQQAADDVSLTRDLPYDLEDAVIALATARYYDDGTGLNVKSEKLLAASITYQEGVTDTGRAILPAPVQQAVAQYGWPAWGGV